MQRNVTIPKEIYHNYRRRSVLSSNTFADFYFLNPKYFFVMPYAFIKEFIIREKKWLKKGGKFILPYPNFKVLNK